MEQSLVQILVVVANIQMRTLKTEVEKGSARTVIDCGLVDPKAWVNSVSKYCVYAIACRKGMDLILSNLNWHFFSGDAKELGDVGKRPGKSYLFFLTLEETVESNCSAKQFYQWKS